MEASSQHQVCSLPTMDLGNRKVARQLWNQTTWFCYLTKLVVTVLRFSVLPVPGTLDYGLATSPVGSWALPIAPR